jgi:UDP-N-acetylglucosamine--N-acetylmuramyl-(pentapeptide) pyrophosphoryl-undecaprenol N-acetylglucosamine transferase
MRCVVAGGGTGGHLFPGIAIAEAFTEREAGNEVLFIGTERGIEVRVLAGGKFALKTIRALPLKGRSFLEKIKALGTLPLALSEALSVLREFRPQIVLGVGGYASGPALLAALLLGIKRAIHEQNMVPGMTNRILRGFSQRIFVSFEETKRYFPGKKTIVTGNPIRKEFLFCSTNRRRQKF